MALSEFWQSVQAGARFVSPNVSVDSPKLDASAIERSLRLSTIWLTPRVVEGFDPDDFNFLPPPQRNGLFKSVQSFRSIAEKVPADKPPTSLQIAKALPSFVKILSLLQPNQYVDPEAFVLGKKIENETEGKLPGWVRELRFQTGDDANGFPAIWIWVEADDKAMALDVLRDNTRAVSEILRQSSRKISPDRWPYVRFRSTSELQAA